MIIKKAIQFSSILELQGDFMFLKGRKVNETNGVIGFALRMVWNWKNNK